MLLSAGHVFSKWQSQAGAPARRTSRGTLPLLGQRSKPISTEVTFFFPPKKLKLVFLRWGGPHPPRAQDYSCWRCSMTWDTFKVAIKNWALSVYWKTSDRCWTLLWLIRINHLCDTRLKEVELTVFILAEYHPLAWLTQIIFCWHYLSSKVGRIFRQNICQKEQKLLAQTDAKTPSWKK